MAAFNVPIHPARKIYLIVGVLLFIVILFSFITVFVPWAWKDIAVGIRVWAYPFKNCIEDMFSTLNAESCIDNDYSAANSVSGGNVKCRGFLEATIVFVFTTVIVGLITLIILGFMIYHLWSKPIILGCVVQFGLLCTFSACMCAWIMFIIYAEIDCQPGSPLFPVTGYSYGFVIHVIATFFALIMLILGCLGLVKTARYKPSIEPPEAYGNELLMYQPGPPSPIGSVVPYWQQPMLPVTPY